MYDADKIIPGLIMFLCVITFPVWYSLANGGAANLPKPKIVTEEEQCIEAAQYMRTKHMDLLLSWRETVVREGVRTYTASEGKEYDMSLTDTCMECHLNKADFCDQCHNSVGVKPNCWDCHNLPEED